jgi:hypothetical protein
MNSLVKSLNKYFDRMSVGVEGKKNFFLLDNRLVKRRHMPGELPEIETRQGDRH